jgi:hypothetical protein
LNLNRTRKLLAVCALAIAAPVTLVACGDDDDGGEDPAELLRTALGQDTDFESGVVNIGLQGSLEGEQSGSLDASVSGPFQSGGEGEPPELQLDADVSVSAEGIPDLPGGSFSTDFTGGFGLADDSLFVTFDGTNYEASPQLYAQIAPLLESATSVQESTSDEQSADALIESLDNLENEGTEDVNGESVTRVSGDIDVAGLAEESGALAPQGITEALESVDLSLAFLVAEEDDTFRGIEVSFAMSDVPESIAASGFEGLDLTLSVGLSEVNEEQSIEAPSDTQPLNELLQQFGTSEREIIAGLQQGLGSLLVPGGVPGATGIPEVPGGGGDLNEISDCLDGAGNDQAAIEACLQS